ncbi:MAG: hypothetical protein J7M21_01875, partial [Planctomycetes bacterium]|nr:hypothetical protein [Planctomycetota bacterium]
YFGFSADNGRYYFAQVMPAELFPPPEAPRLSAERLAELGRRGVLTAGQAARAAAALKLAGAKGPLTPHQRRDVRWLERLRVYLGERAAARRAERRSAINRATYYFRLAVTDGRRRLYALSGGRPAVLSASARPDFFKLYKLNNLLFAVLFSATVLGFIGLARRKGDLFIRRIGGLEAVEEAIGRATEMGRPVYFVHGLGDMNSLATIAAVNILAKIARRAVEYDTRVRVMNNMPIVAAVCQEVVQQAYTEAGRPDAYDPDDVPLVATDQFSYAAAVSGMIYRERPAAIFLLGYFAAESLLLAETGASVGAIQVAGTDAYTQLPFFITTCDYTLIGEELYAASAYLSREPRMLGSLRGQDVGKAVLMAAIVAGSLAMTVAAVLGGSLEWLREMLFKAL